MTREIRCAKLLRQVVPESLILLTIRLAQVVGDDMGPIRVLLVDDDQAVLEMMQRGLESQRFKVTPVTGVAEALARINTDTFDVLVTDQRMPGPADGFTLVSAMRSAQPEVLTVVTSGNPDTQAAMAAIVLQADEILMKPHDVRVLGELIRKRMATHKGSARTARESVAAILKREATAIIADWLERLKEDEVLSSVPLGEGDRMGHLPRLLQDLVSRLNGSQMLTNKQHRISAYAAEHGMLRFSQGYSIEMIVDESRLLQVSIFHGLHNNLHCVDLSTLLVDVMTIADEVDSQLRESIGSYLQHAGRQPAA
jgi:ActR/RegA family two-component response regulator